MDSDDDSDGWGRPRPKFSDLLHSMTPENSDDENGEDEDGSGLNIHMMELDRAAVSTRRVAPLIDHPLTGYAGAPMGELNQLYVNQGITQGVKNWYTSSDNGLKSPHTLYTCIFTCPLSGEHFASGNWHNEKGVTVIDQICWYSTKKYAMTAAAARTLDCLSLRRCHGTEKQPYQRCIDQPYLSNEDSPKLPDLPPDVELPMPLSQAEDNPKEKVSLLPPKRALNEWYLSFYKKLKYGGFDIDLIDKVSPGNECYKTWSNQKKSPNTLFSAMYTCHLSGERFASGKLVEKKGKYVEDNWYFDGTNLIPGDMLNDSGDQSSVQKVSLVWYKTKKDATMAAAARALDCMMYRDLLMNKKTSGTISEERYCVELPYTYNDAPEMWRQLPHSIPDEGGGSEYPSLLNHEFLTKQRGAEDLHSLLELEVECDEENWRMNYKERRKNVLD